MIQLDKLRSDQHFYTESSIFNIRAKNNAAPAPWIEQEALNKRRASLDVFTWRRAGNRYLHMNSACGLGLCWDSVKTVANLCVQWWPSYFKKSLTLRNARCQHQPSDCTILGLYWLSSEKLIYKRASLITLRKTSKQPHWPIKNLP